MRIGIIGQPCIDEIVLPGSNSPERSLGGVLYSYATMERLMRETEAPQPEAGSTPQQNSFVGLTWMSVPDAPIIEPLLSQFRHLDRSAGLWKTPELTNRVQLVYHSKDEGEKMAVGNGSAANLETPQSLAALPERTEFCPNVLPRLTGFQLTPALLSTFDALFINMISGYDISLDTLESSLNAAERRPYVHLDLHALVLGPLSKTSTESSAFGSGRKPRGVRKWKRWLNLADSIQMNEFEARWLGDPEIKSEEDLLKFVGQRRESLSVHDIIITRGERGATLYEVRTEQVHHAAVVDSKKNSPLPAPP